MVLKMPVVSSNNPREDKRLLRLGSFALRVQVCVKLYKLHFPCCLGLQELLPGRQTPQNSLLPPEFSTKNTETAREQSILNRVTNLLQYKRQHY